jgi:hypothetical protein
VLPLLILSGLLAIFVIANGRGWPVAAPIIMLNAAGIVFAIYHSLAL